jgi:hypothetical protein
LKQIDRRLQPLHPLALLRILLSPLVLAALVLTLAAPARAAAHAPRKASGSGGTRKLLLFAKNPADWSIIKGGASGNLVYRSSSGAFTLHASRLHPRSGFALIRVADNPPQGEILARGTSDSRGNLELQGTWHNWSSKFWLVAGEDVAGAPGTPGMLKSWRPERYLFEEKQLGLACACPEPEEPQ